MVGKKSYRLTNRQQQKVEYLLRLVGNLAGVKLTSGAQKVE